MWQLRSLLSGLCSLVSALWSRVDSDTVCTNRPAEHNKNIKYNGKSVGNFSSDLRKDRRENSQKSRSLRFASLLLSRLSLPSLLRGADADKCLAICCRLTPFRHKSQTNCPIACADSYGDRWETETEMGWEGSSSSSLQLCNLLSPIRQCLLIAYINIYCQRFCR